MNYLNLSLFATVFFMVFGSCGNDNSIKNMDYLPNSIEINAEAIKSSSEFPPTDLWIYSAQGDETVDWKVIDKWYRNDMQEYADAPFYENLKAMTYAALIRKINFLDEAPLDVLLFYANEDKECKRLGFLEETADLYGALLQREEVHSAAEFASLKRICFKEYYNLKKDREVYLQEHQEAFAEIVNISESTWLLPLPQYEE